MRYRGPVRTLLWFRGKDLRVHDHPASTRHVLLNRGPPSESGSQLSYLVATSVTTRTFSLTARVSTWRRRLGGTTP